MKIASAKRSVPLMGREIQNAPNGRVKGDGKKKNHWLHFSLAQTATKVTGVLLRLNLMH